MGIQTAIEWLTKSGPFGTVLVMLALTSLALLLMASTRISKPWMICIAIALIPIEFLVGVLGLLFGLEHIMLDPACHGASAPTIESRLDYLPIAFYPMKIAAIFCIGMCFFAAISISLKIRKTLK